MKRYKKAPKQPNSEAQAQAKTARHSSRLLLLAAIIILALVTLACTCSGTTSRLASDQIVILTRLPTLTPTPLPDLILIPTSTPSPLAVAMLAEPTATSTPFPTFTLAPATVSPIPVTPTPSLASLLVRVAALNVRTGPGTQYEHVGQLKQDEQAAIVGQTGNGPDRWWQINFAAGPDGRGWVSADPNLVAVLDAGAVPVAVVAALPPSDPPTEPLADAPTGSPSDTPTPTTAPVVESGGWSFASLRLAPDEDALLMYGDLINNTGSAQEVGFIGGLFYDDQGQVIANDDNLEGNWPVEVVPPGGGMPFELWVEGIQNAANFDLSVEAIPREGTLRQDFELFDLSQANEGTNHCVNGQLHSFGEILEDYLIILTVLYDGEDSVIGYGDYELYSDEIDGAETSDFEICIDTFGLPVARYDIRTWGE